MHVAGMRGSRLIAAFVRRCLVKMLAPRRRLGLQREFEAEAGYAEDGKRRSHPEEAGPSARAGQQADPADQQAS